MKVAKSLSENQKKLSELKIWILSLEFMFEHLLFTFDNTGEYTCMQYITTCVTMSIL